MALICPFCSLPRDRVLHERETAFAIRDGFPVSPGHTLIIPKRHLASFFEVTDAERADLISLLATARDDLNREFRSAGYNIGINDGATAGQTVPHLHMHLIPRYVGDRADPPGGVRWVLPDKAAYWNEDSRWARSGTPGQRRPTCRPARRDRRTHLPTKDELKQAITLFKSLAEATEKVW